MTQKMRRSDGKNFLCMWERRKRGEESIDKIHEKAGEGEEGGSGKIEKRAYEIEKFSSCAREREVEEGRRKKKEEEMVREEREVEKKRARSKLCLSSMQQHFFRRAIEDRERETQRERERERENHLLSSHWL